MIEFNKDRLVAGTNAVVRARNDLLKIRHRFGATKALKIDLSGMDEVLEVCNALLKGE